jgi:hypothetical protein
MVLQQKWQNLVDRRISVAPSVAYQKNSDKSALHQSFEEAASNPGLPMLTVPCLLKQLREEADALRRQLERTFITSPKGRGGVATAAPRRSSKEVAFTGAASKAKRLQ